MSRMLKSTLLCIGVIILGVVIFINLNKRPTYENKLPEQPTSQMLDLFRDKLFAMSIVTKDHEEGYIYLDQWIDSSQLYTSYAFSTTEKMLVYYYDRLVSEEEDKYAIKNVNPNMYLEEISEPTAYDLPDLAIVEDQLSIATALEEKFFSSLTSMSGETVAMENVSAIQVKEVSKEAFYLRLFVEENKENNEYLLFMQQDLSAYELVMQSEESFEQFLQKDTFSSYKHLFPEIDAEGRFVKYITDHQVVDTEEQQLLSIESEDYLSKDGKYVYLGAKPYIAPSNPLPEGKQYVQTLEDYVTGKETNFLTFDLDYKAIQKASDIGGIGTKVSDTARKVVYFNNDLIVISVPYDAIFFGTAGTTNVVVDFHEDPENPDIYVLDLSM